MMRRRLFLGLAPALLAARGGPAAPVQMPTLNERIDHHAAELIGLLRPLAPEGAGSLAVTVADHWNGLDTGRQWWQAEARGYREVTSPTGGSPYWIGQGVWHLNPNGLRWS